jgi:hypothetical protein
VVENGTALRAARPVAQPVGCGVRQGTGLRAEDRPVRGEDAQEAGVGRGGQLPAAKGPEHAHARADPGLASARRLQHGAAAISLVRLACHRLDHQAEPGVVRVVVGVDPARLIADTPGESGEKGVPVRPLVGRQAPRAAALGAVRLEPAPVSYELPDRDGPHPPVLRIAPLPEHRAQDLAERGIVGQAPGVDQRPDAGGCDRLGQGGDGRRLVRSSRAVAEGAENGLALRHREARIVDARRCQPGAKGSIDALREAVPRR